MADHIEPELTAIESRLARDIEAAQASLNSLKDQAATKLELVKQGSEIQQRLVEAQDKMRSEFKSSRSNFGLAVAAIAAVFGLFGYFGINGMISNGISQGVTQALVGTGNAATTQRIAEYETRAHGAADAAERDGKAVGALRAELNARSQWREWTPTTTWGDNVKAMGRWRNVADNVELEVDVLPLRSSDEIVSALSKRKFGFDLPPGMRPSLISKPNRPPVQQNEMTVGSATYWINPKDQPPRLGKLVLLDTAHFEGPPGTDAGFRPEDRGLRLWAFWNIVVDTAVTMQMMDSKDFGTKGLLPKFKADEVWFQFQASFPVEPNWQLTTAPSPTNP